MPAALVISDADGRLSHGVVVTGDVAAWLFGFRLLRLQVDVALIPAHVDRPDNVRPVPTRDPIISRDGPPADRPIALRHGSRSLTLRDARQLLRETEAALRKTEAALRKVPLRD